MEWVTRGLVRSIWSCPYIDWLYLSSKGASGGILLIWDQRVVEKIEEIVGHFLVCCRFKNVSDQFEWAFTGVYGPNLNRKRQLMWEEWIAGGLSHGVWEVILMLFVFYWRGLGAGRFSHSMYDFSDFISPHGLMDNPLEGGLYTWSNSTSTSRIDHSLLSSIGRVFHAFLPKTATYSVI